jgi:hypothetical protein
MSGPLVPIIKGFKVPKVGESWASCRDAWRSNQRRAGLVTPSNLRVAIADGATTASGSGLWGQLLVDGAVEGIAPWRREAYRTRILAGLRTRWHHQASATLPQPLSWFAQASLDRGGFSSLMKVEVRGTTWRAEGWGDSCLFHLRSSQPVQILPDLEPEDFSHHPYLLASVAGHDQDLAKNLLHGEGKLQRGDLLLLATDALACWFLGAQDWPETLRELRGIESDAAFAAWVDDLRRERGLKNDDTTLVVVAFR